IVEPPFEPAVVAADAAAATAERP
ncbi:MAG: hypothetical protein QOD54_554, partial [Sphingomonadales bacterium]|nr:hypothetical protein [Sphingomonadales bacterium]